MKNFFNQSMTSGNVLIIVTVVVIVMLVFSSVLIIEVVERPKVIDAFESATQARYVAEAGLEEVKNYIRTSAYDANGNVWLNTNSSPGGFLAIDDLMIGNNPVDITITELGNGWHQAVASAQINNIPYNLAMEIKGRDSFSRYMFFTHLDDINIGATTVRGDVHSNRRLNFYFGGAKMYGDTTAVRGIGFYYGANAGNTTFYGDLNGYSDSITWPKTSEIATLHNETTGVYQVSNTSSEYSGFGNFNTEIEFIGDQVKITAKKISDGSVLKTGTYPLPANKLIFVQNAVTSIKGDINGRVTVATMDKVDITGSIRYVDGGGDRAYVLKENGVVIEDTPPGVVWSEANGYTYEENSDYDPTVSSAVGIMALKDVTITSAAPYNMEMHAAIFSSQGNWHCDLSEQKGNLRVLGSMTHKRRGWRYSGSGYGWAKSGEYIYDTNLLAAPPDWYLAVDTPVFDSWRRF